MYYRINVLKKQEIIQSSKKRKFNSAEKENIEALVNIYKKQFPSKMGYSINTEFGAELKTNN